MAPFPPHHNATFIFRALTEDFFAAWHAATGTTGLPDLSNYTAPEIRDLQNAVLSLLAPEVRALGPI